MSYQPLLPEPAPIDPLVNFGDIRLPPFDKITYGRNVHHTEDIYYKIYNDIDIDGFVIDHLVEVTNPYLKMSFDLRRAEKMEKCGPNMARSYLLYHGTSKANVDDIFDSNFKWWLYGKHRFGMGLNFSASIRYASNYGDPGFYRVMLIADVFLNKYCYGHPNMSLPDVGCDASVKNNDLDVVVKYDDCEFLPIYKLFYHIEKYQEPYDWYYTSDYYHY